MSIRVDIEGKGVVAEFPDGTPESVIDVAVKRDFFPKEESFGRKALSFVTMGHVTGPGREPEKEVEFTPEGQMIRREVPSADPGFFEDPITAAAFGAVAGARAAAGPVGKLITAGREALGWATGGASEVPALAKAGAKGIAKAVEAKPLAELAQKRQAKGVFESVTPEAKVTTEAAKVGEKVAEVAPKTLGGKQPWERTKEDYVNSRLRNQSINNISSQGTRGFADEMAREEKAATAIHESAVKTALSEGKPVPPSVLKDYPGLAESGLEQLAKEQTKEAQKGMIGLDIGKKPKEPAWVFENPETNTLLYAARNRKPEGIWNRLKETATSVGRKFTRDYEHLPNTKENSQLIFDLSKLSKQKEVVADGTVRNIGEMLSGLSKKEYDIFNWKVVLDDLASDVERGLYAGKELPFKFSSQSLNAERQRLEMALTPKIAEALEKRRTVWEQIKNDYIETMSPYKPNVEDMFKENYYRHQVLDHIEKDGLFGSGKKLKPPTSRGYTKERTGYSGLYNTDFLEAEHNVMAQMLHDIQIAKTLTKIGERENIVKMVKETAKASGLDDWHRAIPEGYTAWQPKEGNVFYPALTVTEKDAAEILAGGIDDLADKPGLFKEAMVMGGKRKEWVVRNEVAETLNNLVKEKPTGAVAEINRQSMRAWKQWQLVSPRRFPKYNARNLTGDAEAVFLGNPSGFKKAPQAVRELFDVFYKKKDMSPDMAEWFSRGGMSSTLQAQEMGALKDLWMFTRLYEKKGADLGLWGKYWRTVRMATDFRESVLRYANYIDFKEQLVKGGGKPAHYAASKPEMIDGLQTVQDKAYWLSNDLLGAYDRVAVAGQAIRERWVPFWSWQEVNFKRYIQLYKNAANEGEVAVTIGKQLGARTPMMALKVGRLALKTAAFTVALQVYNHTVFPEEEKILPEEVKNTPHIIFGKDSEGKIIYFNRMGTLDDFISWFGLDYAPQFVDEFLSGKKTIKEAAQDQITKTLQSPVNKITMGGIPFTKLAGEFASRRSTFPDIFRMGTVRDRWAHVARSFGMENEYDLMAQKPSRGYLKSVREAFVYTIDPGEAAYRNIYDVKNRYLEKLGQRPEGFWMTKTGDALYNMKLAIKYNDREAYARYFTAFVDEAKKQWRTPEEIQSGLEQSMKAMHPLFGLKEPARIGFLKSLSEDEKEYLQQATDFFKNTLAKNLGEFRKQGGTK